ncbi:SAUR-like auxin-responsive protein family [Actinidia rufa]|uniref:SAUR-like auxin-responsive protein family n=1 Tax=Actinidia rufa TaxID=165716 RepID=A0A7J0GEJ6_9ERIC|nr:SAUR-like auxin-responsive protein family [Actinidia rufa]
MGSMKKQAKKVKIKGGSSQQESLLRESCNTHDWEGSSPRSSKMPTGFFALYVGRRERGSWYQRGTSLTPSSRCCWTRPTMSLGSSRGMGLWCPAVWGLSKRESVLLRDAKQGKFDFGNLVQEFI